MGNFIKRAGPIENKTENKFKKPLSMCLWLLWLFNEPYVKYVSLNNIIGNLENNAACQLA